MLQQSIDKVNPLMLTHNSISTNEKCKAFFNLKNREGNIPVYQHKLLPFTSAFPGWFLWSGF